MNRVLESLHEEMVTPAGKVRIACSAGMSLFPEDGADGAALLSCADAAMYGRKARRAGGS
jgi:GGDEF domain-containing protein